MKKVYYIGWYISDEDKTKYRGNVPGNLKMHYVVEQLMISGFIPEIISLASRNDQRGFYRNNVTNSQGCILTYLGGIGGNNHLAQRVDLILKKIIFVYYFILKFKRQDTIILYHSVAITNLCARLKRLVKRKVIVEVEEVYGYSAIEDKPWVKNEINCIKQMDYYIFVNDGIPQDLDIAKERFVVSFGVGRIPKRTKPRLNDGKIHVVYAGTIEMRKLGAMTAVESARYFPDNYILHVLGLGTEKNIQILKDAIAEINKEVGYNKIEYNGYKSGKELDDFLFSCHIGLSSHVMRPNFANNSFPSKVVTYMCHDLAVVLGYAKAFYDVPMAEGWEFYYEDSPRAIAKAVSDVGIKPIGFYIPRIENMNQQLQNFFKKYC